MNQCTEKTQKPYCVMHRGGIITCALLTLLTPVGLFLIRLARGNPAWVEQHYSLGWYRGIAKVLTALTGGARFSVMEVILLLLGAAAVGYLVFWAVELIRHHADWWKICLKRIWILLSICSAIFFYFILTGDLNYYRYSVGSSLGLTVEATDAETLKNLCLLLAERANTYRESVGEDENGIFTPGEDYPALAEAASAAVSDLDRQYGVRLFSLAERTRPKAMAFSEVMSYIRLTGVIFPYIMEANINVHQPSYGIPSTMCHELSHICGYMREDEANFISYLACIGSGQQDFAYSGTMLALIHSTNQLYAVDPEGWSEVRELLSDGVRRDLAANSLYWAKYDTPVGDSASRVNDAYLKANDQPDGLKSYGRMVDLLIAFYRADATI